MYLVYYTAFSVSELDGNVWSAPDFNPRDRPTAGAREPTFTEGINVSISH
jgi:hypothetical protein